jgi:serine/threonine-protein kinase
MVLQTESPVERTNTASGTTAPVEEIKESTPDPTVKTEAAEPRKATTPFTKGDPGLGQYKVISKAYFHNEPDESTRRKAFIIHWNNAVLTPQEEENGFVYIVFTNHLGQTSKGWLQIKDLRRID